MGQDWHLAQIKNGRRVVPVTDQAVAEFIAAPGFVQRRRDEAGGGATGIRPEQAGPPIDTQPDPWCVGRA